MKRFLPLLLLFLFLSGCSGTGGSVDSGFYERSSGLKLPASAVEEETLEKEELATTTAFRGDSLELVSFVQTYCFDTMQRHLQLRLFNSAYMEQDPAYGLSGRLYYKTGNKNKNHWMYVVDLEQKMLWAEVQFGR